VPTKPIKKKYENNLKCKCKQQGDMLNYLSRKKERKKERKNVVHSIFSLFAKGKGKYKT
jgi:hypothetical protein